jgi:hypothetical protein
MNYSRADLVQTNATMNQLRNAIYHLQRFMKRNDITEVRSRLRRMGKNIAHTYLNTWRPIEKVTLTNIKDVLATIYKNVLDSTVSIELDEVNKKITVQDNDCALCKYQFTDINVAGCEIIGSMITEFINVINSNQDGFKIEIQDIDQSKIFGHNSCIHIYNFTGGK